MASVAIAPDEGLTRNLNGQKLGRKGRDTRARILAEAAALIREAGGEPVTLSAVARRASLGMTSLYLYFSDLTELILALLEPVVATSEEDFLYLLRDRWPDDELPARCRQFVEAFHAHWERHAALLHLRNRLADAHDLRLMETRVGVAETMIRLLLLQMDGDDTSGAKAKGAMASLLMTALERAATVRTDKTLHELYSGPVFDNPERFLGPAARLLELALRDGRSIQE